MGQKLLLSLFAFLFAFNSIAAQPVRDEDDDVVTQERELKFVDNINLTAKPNVTFTVGLRTLLTQPDIPGTIKWQLQGAPGWLQISGDNLTGQPSIGDAQAGTVTFTLFARLDEAGTSTQATVTVLSIPKWSLADIDLGITNEDQQNWTYNLNDVAKDPSGGKLTFKATGLPAWMHLDETTGILSGIPRRPDVGHYQGITFTAVGLGGSATATGHGDVKKTIHPPKWIAKKITLTPNATEDTEYTKNLNEFILNQEGATLSYEIVSEPPPPWLHVGSTGLLYGNPHKDNIGTKTFSVRLAATIDGVPYDDTTEFQLTVDHVNHAPAWLSKTFDLGNGFSGKQISQNLGNSAKDPDMPIPGDVLTFKIVSYAGPGANWATMDPASGMFTGTPKEENIGDSSWVVSVTDQGGLSDTATVKVKIAKALVTPKWNNHPTLLPNAHEDLPYQVDLTKYATDPNLPPRAMTFTKLDGPAWISISPQGILSGTPGKDALGVVKLNARVQNDVPGSDVSELQIFVEHTNHAPFWTMNPIFLNAEEDKPFSQSLAVYAGDPDIPNPGDKLTFSLIEGKPWAKLSADGVLSGTPAPADEGDNRYKVRVMDQAGETADTVVMIHVPHVNHAPKWTGPIDLPHGKEDTPFSVNISQFAKDPDGDPLTFRKIGSLPDWITVSTDGTLSGTPRRKDVGDNAIDVTVEDPAHLNDTTTVHIIIDKVLHPPYWRQKPLQMADAWEDTPYNFNLNDYIANPEGSRLTFRLVKGPSWMLVSSDGKVTGVPGKKDIGAFPPVTFAVSDGVNPEVTDDAVGQVIHKNHLPVISPDLPIFTMKERSLFQENLNQPKYISDPDGDQLHCTLEEEPPPDWVVLADNCQLTAKPLYKHIGDRTFRFKVSDGQAVVHGNLRLHVDRDPRPPVWLVDPLEMEAKTNQLFTDNLNTAEKVKDLDGLKLTFAKVSGPDWLRVDADGSISGTPTDAALGPNAFKVKACNDVLCAEVALNILVKPGTQIDTVQLDSVTPGAPSELLWVVDNADQCDKVIRSLKSNVHWFFDDLTRWQVHHSGIFLGGNVMDESKAGLPIVDGGGPLLMLWSAGNIVADFNRRTDLAFVECGTNSPVWSMWRWYERLAKMPEVYHNTYFKPSVPMDVMIVTQQRDHYKAFTKDSPLLQGYTPQDFSRDFGAFHREDKKPFRINVVAAECPTLIEGEDKGTLAPENTYKVLVDKTKGKYYGSGTCDFDMATVMHDYASRVNLRAQINAKNRVVLTKTPKETNTIRLFIGGNEIPGNTGAPTDRWYYEASPVPTIVIRWDLIGDDGLKPGDLIRIEYRIS